MNFSNEEFKKRAQESIRKQKNSLQELILIHKMKELRETHLIRKMKKEIARTKTSLHNPIKKQKKK